MGYHHHHPSICVSIVGLLFFLLISSTALVANSDLSSVASIPPCLLSNGVNNFVTPRDGNSFTTLLNSTLQNLRFTGNEIVRPVVIILPTSTKQVQVAMLCIRDADLILRVRSGGHSFEGISSTASSQFAIIDLINLRRITVDVGRKSVWAQSGATTGELYYAIASKTSMYGVSAGTCSTIGLGGHVAGGGFGQLSRKYGLTSDNVLDAQMITPNGTVINSMKSADKDLFWAIRGGGGGSWGVVVAWKLKLVPVPAVITTFSIWRTGKDAVADLVYKWQSVAPSAPKELFIAVYMAGILNNGRNDTGASIYGQYWGSINDTVDLLNSIFPELGLTAPNCRQGSWGEASANNAGLSSLNALMLRNTSKNYLKAKSDYVAKPLTKQAILGALNILEANTQGFLLVEPYGGVMSEIKSNASPFPHRGNLFVIQYQSWWSSDVGSLQETLIRWLHDLYGYMASYVAYIPARAAYVNYIDLDLGNGSVAGKSYFGNNFRKLVKIKARIDPQNVFNAPQSVPAHL